MRALRCFVGAILALLIVAGTGATAENPSSSGTDTLKAGFARVEITPKEPVQLSGYASRTERSNGVHDPLYARAVALRLDDGKLVLVSADLIGYREAWTPFREKILDRFGLKPSELFLAATHSHSAPTPMLGPDGDPNNVAYTRQLGEKLVEVVAAALSDQTPVTMGVGRGASPIGVNRRELTDDGRIRLGRNPEGPTDKEVLVLALARSGNAPPALLFDYATHCTAMGPKNLTISSDVLGLASQFVERHLGSEAIAVAFAGASGDIDPWFRVLPAFQTENHWTPEVEVLGTMLGEEVVQVLRKIEPRTQPAAIRSSFAVLDLPGKRTEAVRNPPSKLLAVTVARVGDVGFVGLGAEVLTEIGLAIKAGSPFKHTFVITHCNDTAGYLPPKHCYPQGGYEVESSGFGPTAAEIVVRQSIAMLHELK